MENDSLRQLHRSSHFVFWRTTSPIWIVLHSQSGRVPPSLRGEIWMAFGKPTLTTSMRLAGAYVNGIKNEQILGSACICSREDLPLRTLRLRNFLRCYRYSGRSRSDVRLRPRVAATYDAANVTASARYPSSWTIKATSTSISWPTFWSFGICANSSAASIGSMSCDPYGLEPCHALGPRALRYANHIHARGVGKGEAEVVIRGLL